jgi:hypothetical protein
MPPFEDIARRPNFGESGLLTFLLDSHAKLEESFACPRPT